MATLKNFFTDLISTVNTTQGTNKLGERRFQGQKELVYVKAGATITQYQALQYDPAVDDGYQVIPTAAVTDELAGVAEAGGASSGNFFWMTVKGPATCKIATGATAGQGLAPSATAGVLAAPANTDVAAIRAKAQADGAATNAAKPIVMV